jgi:hypothetical protein
MRAVLAVGLLIALLGASADAATVRRARHHLVVQRSAVPTLAAVPGARTAPASAAVDELGGGDFQCTLAGACLPGAQPY